MKAKGKNPVPVKWVFKSKEKTDGLICMKSINVVKGYMQVPGVELTDSFSPVTPDTSTSTLIGLTLYYKDNVSIVELCDVEAAFIHPNTKVEMYIEWPEGTVDLGITIQYFMRECCILLGKSMYENVDAALLWLRLLAKYLFNEFNLKRSKADL